LLALLPLQMPPPRSYTSSFRAASIPATLDPICYWIELQGAPSVSLTGAFPPHCFLDNYLSPPLALFLLIGFGNWFFPRGGVWQVFQTPPMFSAGHCYAVISRSNTSDPLRLCPFMFPSIEASFFFVALYRLFALTV